MVSDPFGSSNNVIDVSKIVKYNQSNMYGDFEKDIPSSNLKLISSGFTMALVTSILISNKTHRLCSLKESL